MAAVRVQSVVNQSSSSTSIPVTATQGWAAPTVGNLIVAWYGGDNTCTAPTGYTAGPNVVDNNAVYFWWKIAVAGDSAGVTFTQAGASPGTAGLIEYSGIVSASPAETAGGSATYNSLSVYLTSTGTLSQAGTSANGDLFIALAGCHNWNSAAAPTGPTWTNSFSNFVNISSTSGNISTSEATFLAELQNTAAATASTVCSWTNSSIENSALLIAFKLAAGGAAPAPPAGAITRRRRSRAAGFTPIMASLRSGFLRRRRWQAPHPAGPAAPAVAASVKAVGTVVDAGTAAASITLPVPAGTAPGDYLVAVLYSNVGTSATDWDMAATGFTRLGPAFIPTDTGQRVGGLFGRAVAGAPPASYTWTTPDAGASVRTVGVLVALADVDPVTPVSSSTAWTESAAAAASISVAAGGTDGDLTLAYYAADFASPNSYAGMAATSGQTLQATLISPAGTENTAVSRTYVQLYGDVAPTGGVPAHTWGTASSPSSHRAAYLLSFNSTARQAGAALTTTVSLSAGPVLAQPATAALSTTVSLGAAPTRAVPAVAALTTTVNLAAPPTQERPALAALTTTATLGAPAVQERLALAALTTTASLAAPATVAQPATAALSTTVTLAAAGAAAQPATAALVTTPSLAAPAVQARPAVAALTTTVSLAAPATQERPGTAALVTTPSLSVVVTAPAAAALTTTPSLTAGVVQTQPALAALSTSVTLDGQALQTQPGAATLTTTVSLAAFGVREQPVVAVLATTVTLAAPAGLARPGIAALTTFSSLAAPGTQLWQATAALATTVTLAAPGNVGTFVVLATTVTLAAPATQARAVAVALATTVTLAGSPTQAQATVAALTTTAALAGSPTQARPAAAALTTTVTIAVVAGTTGAAALTTTVTLQAAGVRELPALAALTTAAALTAPVVRGQPALAALSTGSTLAAGVTLTQATAAALVTSAVLGAAGTLNLTAAVQLLTTVTLAAVAQARGAVIPGYGRLTVQSGGTSLHAAGQPGRLLLQPAQGGIDSSQLHEGR